MADILYVDTVDMGTHGLKVRRVTGQRSMPKREWPLKVVPGSANGGLFMSNEANVEPRTVVVYGTVIGTSHADMMSKVDDLISDLQSTGQIDVSFSDDLTQKLVCRCSEVDVDDYPAGYLQPAVQVAITLIAANPNYVAV